MFYKFSEGSLRKRFSEYVLDKEVEEFKASSHG